MLDYMFLTILQIGHIRASRQEVFSVILDIFRGLLHILPGIDFEGPRACHSCPPATRVPCEALMLGKLIQWLIGKSLWPFPDPSSIETSINQLTMQVRTCPSEVSGYHGSCRLSPYMDSWLKRITEAIHIPEEFVAHISAQGKKSGLVPRVMTTDAKAEHTTCSTPGGSKR